MACKANGIPISQAELRFFIFIINVEGIIPKTIQNHPPSGFLDKLLHQLSKVPAMNSFKNVRKTNQHQIEFKSDHIPAYGACKQNFTYAVLLVHPFPKERLALICDAFDVVIRAPLER